MRAHQIKGAKFSDEDIKALTHRIQFGGDEVVQAKDGAGSATLSMVSENTTIEAIVRGWRELICQRPVSEEFLSFDDLFIFQKSPPWDLGFSPAFHFHNLRFERDGVSYAFAISPPP